MLALLGSALVLGVSACGLSSYGELVLPGGMDAQAARDTSTDSSRPDTALATDTGASDSTALAETSTMDTGSSGDSGLHDAAVADTTAGDVIQDVLQMDTGCGTCALTPPATWSLVAFATSTTAPCPAGFGTTDVVENATPGAACMCGSTCQASADCTQIQIPTSAGNGCNQNASPVNPGSGACTDYSSFFIGPECGVGSVQLAAAGPQCIGPTPTQDIAAIVAQHDRICEAPASCAAAVCDPSVTASFKTCIVASGDQACPAAAPNKHAVGSPSLACGSCPCTATVQCEGTLTFYPESGCNGEAVAIPMGGCVGVSMNEPIGSYRWTASASPAPNCTVGPPSAPTVTLTSPATVCCP